MTTLTISQLAHRSGVPATTLRYYERAGILPAPARSDSGYRLYDEAAVARLAFVQRAKSLGIDLDDIGELVRLWDGEECGPVQEQVRATVHDQRAATARRLEELTQLAADLDAVAATLGATDTCGPDCACVRSTESRSELPMASERMIGAACTLDAAELKQRLADWRALRDRAMQPEPIPGGIRLTFAQDEPAEPIARLAALESECCAFYTFTLRVDGPRRQLEISAGVGGEPAVQALLGLDLSEPQP
ncbi:MAG: MerR family transcriptional regulator [Candidatus Limnocylindria bacterium]